MASRSVEKIFEEEQEKFCGTHDEALLFVNEIYPDGEYRAGNGRIQELDFSLLAKRELRAGDL